MKLKKAGYIFVMNLFYCFFVDIFIVIRFKKLLTIKNKHHPISQEFINFFTRSRTNTHTDINND